MIEMISDLFSMSVRNMNRRKMRTFLTFLGIVIGVSAVVALISIGQGMQMSINQMFQDLHWENVHEWLFFH